MTRTLHQPGGRPPLAPTTTSHAMQFRRMPRVLVGLLLAAGLAARAVAHDGPHDHPEDSPPVLAWPDAAYLPTPLPDRVCLSITADPAREVAVTWRTRPDVEQSLLEIAVATGGPDFTETVRQIEGHSATLTTDLGRARFHEARAEGLEPATRYLYRVGKGEHWSEWNQLQTAAADREPFVFVYFGDAQNDVRSHWSRVVRNAFRDAPRAAFFLHAGDLINRAESDREWGEWFEASGFIHRTIPVLATPGNHEMAKAEDGSRRLSRHWRPTFAFPEQGPAGLEETCYAIDYQGARFVSLNSNERLDEQVAWLEAVLAEGQPTWKIVTFHHPVYSSAKGRDNQALRELWQPVFDRLGVDLVLQGHDHTYARSPRLTFEPGSLEEVNLAVGKQRSRSDAGTVYVVSVSGPKMYDLEPQAVMASWATRTQLYQVISVEPERIRYRALNAIGDLHDAFTLERKPDGSTHLSDHPEAPRSP